MCAAPSSITCAAAAANPPASPRRPAKSRPLPSNCVMEGGSSPLHPRFEDGFRKKACWRPFPKPVERGANGGAVGLGPEGGAPWAFPYLRRHKSNGTNIVRQDLGCACGGAHGGRHLR